MAESSGRNNDMSFSMKTTVYAIKKEISVSEKYILSRTGQMEGRGETIDMSCECLASVYTYHVIRTGCLLGHTSRGGV